MRFNSRLRVIGVVLIFPLLLHAQAGPPLPARWASVQELPAGTRVRVHLIGGKQVTGAVHEVSLSTLSLSKGAATVELARAELGRVYRFVPRSKASAAAIGAGVGAGIGTGLGAWAYSQGDLVKSVVPAAALVGAGIGAVVSLLFAFRSKSVLIYAPYPAKETL